MIFTATIKQGTLSSGGKITEYIKKFEEGQRLVVDIRKPYKARTNKQNAYLMAGILSPMSEHTGYSLEEIHEVCHYMFAPKKEIRINRRIILTPKRCREMTIQQFNEFVERIIAEATQSGVVIMSPDEYYGQ